MCKIVLKSIIRKAENHCLGSEGFLTPAQVLTPVQVQTTQALFKDQEVGMPGREDSLDNQFISTWFNSTWRAALCSQRQGICLEMPESQE